jgi:hypothetical protein
VCKHFRKFANPIFNHRDSIAVKSCPFVEEPCNASSAHAKPFSPLLPLLPLATLGETGVGDISYPAATNASRSCLPSVTKAPAASQQLSPALLSASNDSFHYQECVCPQNCNWPGFCNCAVKVTVLATLESTVLTTFETYGFSHVK